MLKSKSVENMLNSSFTLSFNGHSFKQLQTANAKCGTCHDEPESAILLEGLCILRSLYSFSYNRSKESSVPAHHVEEDDGVEYPQQRALAPLVPEVVTRVLHADGLRGLLGLVARERQLLVGLHRRFDDLI
jgi:hypothetical protein